MSDIQRRELFPGVWLRSIHTDKFKSSYLSVTLLAPLDRQTAAENALLPYVLRRGTRRHGDMQQITAALDELYGGGIEPILRKKGETQCVGFLASFLDDAYTLSGEKILEPAARLLGELLLQPKTEQGVFCAEYVTGERDNLIDRIRAAKNDKRQYAVSRLVKTMCGEERYGVSKLGSVERAQAITPASLWQRYQQLLSTAAVEVYYCGSAEPERVEQALREALADLPRNEERLVPECEIRLHAPQKPNCVEEPMDVTQGKLAMGFRTGGVTCWEEEYPALVMCNALFGGTAMSKLFMNVREKLSLCYYASSSLDVAKGIMMVSSGIEFDKYEQARKEILFQLDEIRQGHVDDWELEGARRILMGARLSIPDEQGSQEQFWLGQAVTGLEETPEQFAGRLEQVTLEQIVAVAQKIELDTIYFLKGKEE